MFGFTRTLIEKMFKRAFCDFIRNVLPSYYKYHYDGGKHSITDGGQDIFDNGNMVSIEVTFNNSVMAPWNHTVSPHPDDGFQQ